MPTDPQPERSIDLTARTDDWVLEFFQWAFELPDLELGETFTLSFGEEGMSVLAPDIVGTVSWGESVNDLAIYVHEPRDANDRASLHIYHENDEFDDETYEYSTVEICIEAAPEGVQPPRLARVSELRKVINDINLLRGVTTVEVRAGGPIKDGVPLEPYVSFMGDDSSEPTFLNTRSAYSAARRAFLPMPITFTVVISTIASCILLIVRGGSPIAGVMFIVLAVIAIVIATITRFQLELAIARERQAGYTTLNGADLELQQRHPRTGAVIRSAFEPALTKKEFAAALRGVAA